MIWLRTHKHIGDELILTSVVRDMVYAHGTSIDIGVYSSYPDIWKNNPYIKDLKTIHTNTGIFVQYPGDQHTADKGSCIQGFHKSVEKSLNISIPVTKHAVDIHLTPEEASSDNPYGRYILLNAGYMRKVPVKGYNHYQEVVTMCHDITFIQVGGPMDIHPKLSGDNVINMVGRTTVRQLILLMYHAVGSLSPVSNAVHLASAWNKPCVVIAGGREPETLTGYPESIYLSSIGKYPCCHDKGCFKFSGCPHKIHGVFSKCMNEIPPDKIAEQLKKIWIQ